MTTAVITDPFAASRPGSAESWRIETTTNFSVDVVDGNGLPVSYQPVAAEYRYPNAPPLQTGASTDADGRARFSNHHIEAPLTVTFDSGRERSGPHTLERHLFTIEM